MKLTLVISKGESGFLIGQIQEIPAVLTQGKTKKEVKANILDALQTYLEAMRHYKPAGGDNIISTEEIQLPVA